MAKVGLKETLALLAAGYKKKDIEALAEIDDQQQEEKPAEDPVPASAPAPAPAAETPKQEEPDYKKMYEDLKKKNEETQAKITKLQQDNIHKDSAPALEEQKKEEQDGLLNMVRSFM